ncbi:nucleoside-diphosphate kinase [Cryptosporidium bovis]|uniref:nucleoside-diphosphate kinase n=1 Tax=Cryptosporidium bovis TaxID=310047 RepID=UPI00351A85E3|nr:nucleoside-diphosphate kinase [Cryptosporidium bovis]
MRTFRLLFAIPIFLLFGDLLHGVVGENITSTTNTTVQGNDTTTTSTTSTTTTTTPVTATVNATSVASSSATPVTTDPLKERTLILLKPEVTHRGLIGKLISDIEQKGFKIVAMKFIVASKELIEAHYSDHANKPFYPALVKRTSNQPIVAIVLEGLSAVSEFRRFMGLTDPKKSPLGTLRATYGMQSERNLLHASDSIENAHDEISLWFSPDEIFDYNRVIDAFIYYN